MKSADYAESRHTCPSWTATILVTADSGVCDADDVLGFTGPKAEAEEIKHRLIQILREDSHVELSGDNTLVTHTRTNAASFLGYEATTHTGTGGRRSLNGTIALRVPTTVIKTSYAPHLARSAPAAQRALLDLDDHDIVAAYGPGTGKSSSTTRSPAAMSWWPAGTSSTCR